MVQSKSSKVPVFHPTKEQINGSFEAYINSIEPKCKKLGICKIVPPKGWSPRKDPAKLDITITRPIEQTVTGKQGLYQALQLERKAMSLLHDFKPRAEAPENQPPKGASPEELEREFWRSMSRTPPIYGADVEESLFDPKTKGWNIRNLDSLLTRVLAERIPGVNTPYLYFGMWRTFFGWHTEDMELHSINYLHFGAPKSWYCIAPEHRQRFETMVKGLVPDMFRACPEFFRHKELLVSPSLLAHHSVPVLKFCQYPGEIVINFSGAYHSGFNHGYNCAESTNFATRSWIEQGVHANSCQCREDAVAIDMRMFSDAATPRVRKLIRETIYSESEESDSEDSDDESTSEEEESSDDESDASSGSEQEIPASRPQPARRGPAGGARKEQAQKAAPPRKPPAQPRKRPAPLPAKQDTTPRKRGRPASVGEGPAVVKEEQQTAPVVRGRGRPAGPRKEAIAQSSTAPVKEGLEANSKLESAVVGTRKSTRAGRGQIRRIGDLTVKISVPEQNAGEHDDGGSEQSTFGGLPSPSSSGDRQAGAGAESACKRQVFKA